MQLRIDQMKMSEGLNNKSTRVTRDHGFSVLELLTAMAIFVIVTGSVWGILEAARGSRNVVSQQNQLAKNVRIALNVIGRDAYNAGYGYPLKNTVVLPDNRISALLNLPHDSDTQRDIVPPIISGNNVTLNTYNTAAGVYTDQVTFLFKDTSFNLLPVGDPNAISTPLAINAATTTVTGIDEVVPLSGGNAACALNDLYLVTGNTGSTLGVVTGLPNSSTIQFANGDILGFNLTGPSGTLRAITVPASIQRVFMVTYFVTPDGVLTRRKYANRPPTIPATPYVDEPLVYDVEDFQIRYVMNDGSISDNPSAGPDGIPGTPDDTQANLAAIRQVRFTISVRSRELMANNQPYRDTMTVTYSTRNLGYDAN